MIGVNDLASRGWPVALVLKNYARIVDKITKGSPKTKLFVQSVLPINEEMISIERFKGTSIFIKEFNEKLIVLSASKKLIYVDLFNQFIDDTGKLKKEFTNDGIHLTPLAYTAWVKYLKDNKYL